MPDPRIANLAKVIVDYSVGIKPGDQVFLTATPAATPLIHEMYRLIMQHGGHLTPIISLPGMNPIFYRIRQRRPIELRPAGTEAGHRDLRRADRDQQRDQHPRADQRRSGQTGAACPGAALALADLHGSQRQRRAALERDAVPHRRATPRTPTCRWRSSRTSSTARACATGPTRSLPGRRSQRKQQILVDWLAGKQEVHLRRSRHRPDRRHRRAHLRQLLRRQKHAGRRSLHRPGGDQGQRPRLLQLPRHLPGPRSQRRPAVVRGWRRGQELGGQERGVPDPDAEHGRRRAAASANSPSAPTSASSASSRASCSTKRSAARCTWRWAAAIPRPAPPTARPSTGT